MWAYGSSGIRGQLWMTGVIYGGWSRKQNSHLELQTLRRECELEIAQVFTLLKPTSSEILPSTNPYTLSLPTLCH